MFKYLMTKVIHLAVTWPAFCAYRFLEQKHMKTDAIETSFPTGAAGASHQALLRLQAEVDQKIAEVGAQAEAEARRRAAAQKEAEAAPASRVRFAHD